MIGKMTITYKGFNPDENKKEQKENVVKALIVIPLFWHEKYLKEHFQEFSILKYGMRGRTRMYNETKFKRYGHRKALVFTGRLQQAMQNGGIMAAATINKVTGTMNATKYVNFHNKRMELTSWTQQEIDKTAEVFEEKLYGYIEENKTETKKEI